MMDILFTRLLLWKKKAVSMLFWLLLPVVGTSLFITTVSTIEEDSKVPIGIISEDNTELASELINSVEASELVRVSKYSVEQALYELEKHELDSVFVIHDGFEKAILSGKRNNLISSYRTELSFAYSPVKELIVSLVQEESGRAKVANFILNMNEEYKGEDNWTWEEVNEKSKEIQVDENLLNTSFSYSNTNEPVDNPSLLSWDTWGIWAILSLLSALFLSDWIIREKSLAVTNRFSFIKMTRFSYYFKNIVCYFLLFFLFDLISITVFTIYLNEAFSISFLFVIVTFRVMLCLLTFSLAQCFRKTGVFYGFSILITLILAVISGTIIPILPQSNMIELLNPLQAFLKGDLTILWNITGIITITMVLIRKETSNA
ncbi:ABC transporter permease [Paucisalibacillus sp. EB02]|uniref:ABC transporter permease n=1 Tax=Paucisalibacillus sp. EB02 TaxID=1347087 RepID=UPI0004BA6E7B|nr:ABC transporter permease [Paucisalibacillus sp. EB02]